MMSVDILPASLPLDASKHFSKVFLPYMESLIENYTSGHCDEYASALDRATIAANGQLVGKHNWLQGSVDKLYTSAAAQAKTAHKESVPPIVKVTPEADKPVAQPGIVKKKKLLMLGSGMVAGPAVDEIAKRADVQLLIGLDLLLSEFRGSHQFSQRATPWWKLRSLLQSISMSSTGLLTWQT
jgi:alpha-aminoadipic semialdehyde synthase